MVRVCKCIYNKEAYNVLLLLVALLNRTIAKIIVKKWLNNKKNEKKFKFLKKYALCVCVCV